MSERFQQARRQVDEMTTEKFGAQAGKRSMKRSMALVGLGLLLLLFVQAEIVYFGLLLNPEETNWSTYKGWFMWIGGFSSSTLIPYIVSHFRRTGDP